MGLVRAVALSTPPLLTLLLGCSGARPLAAPTPAPSASAAVAVALLAARADRTLLARKILFGNDDRSDVQISPDGQRIGWLAASQGNLNLYVSPADDLKKAHPVTQETALTIRSWRWTFDPNRIVFSRAKDGDDDLHVCVVDLVKNETKDLTAIDGARAELVGLSLKHPREALVSLKERDKPVQEVDWVDMVTGARKPVMQGDATVGRWLADDDLHVRYAVRQNADATVDLVEPVLGKDAAKWKVFQHVPMEDALTSVDFDKTNSAVYLKDSRNRDTTALFALDIKTGKTTLVSQDAHADVGQVLLHPTTRAVEAVSFDYDHPAWRVVDASVELDFEYLETFGDGALVVTSRSLDDQSWLVGYAHSDGPTHFYRYDRDPARPGESGKATLLFGARDDLEIAKLSSMKPVIIKARDGLELVGYLTLPQEQDARAEDRPKVPLATVILVHDGPWSRASLEYSPEHQWLASRGYAVLSVNFRGSTGFGTKFANAGNLEWGGKMHDDLMDAVAWVVEQQIADPTRVALMGAGYGGYETLDSMAMNPDTFACGVDIGGPTNLVTFGQTAPVDSRPPLEELARRMGDWRTDDGKKLLSDRSPAMHAGGIKKPLLIAQGKDDPRVREADTAELVAALRLRTVPVTYVVYSDEARALARPANRASFHAVAEVFLSQCLGGPYQPFVGDDFAGSTISVPAGAEHVRGLRAALAAKK
jgi:dipeptidyl aminopeptidase/acylaminoacyl peptidase